MNTDATSELIDELIPSTPSVRSPSSSAVLHVPLRAAGAALVLAGVLLAIMMPLHPNILYGRDIAEVVRDTPAWGAIHAAGAVAAMLALFGAAGIVALHGRRLGRLGARALVVTIVGSATVAGVWLTEVVFPPMAQHAPELLDLHGPLLSSPLFLALAAPAVGFPFGFAALGVAAARARVHRGAGIALASSALAFAIFEGAFVPVLGVLSGFAFGGALAWWGWVLWHTDPAAID